MVKKVLVRREGNIERSDIYQSFSLNDRTSKTILCDQRQEILCAV